MIKHFAKYLAFHPWCQVKNKKNAEFHGSLHILEGKEKDVFISESFVLKPDWLLLFHSLKSKQSRVLAPIKEQQI
jgi:hypothetical protein